VAFGDAGKKVLARYEGLVPDTVGFSAFVTKMMAA
jgi:hypothetical protein